MVTKCDGREGQDRELARWAYGRRRIWDAVRAGVTRSEHGLGRLVWCVEGRWLGLMVVVGVA